MRLPSPFLDDRRRFRNGWWILFYWFLMAPIVFPVGYVIHELALEPTEAQRFALTAFTLLAAAAGAQWLRGRPLAELGVALDARVLRELGVGAALGSALMAVPALLLSACGAVRWHLGERGLAALADGLVLMAAVAAAEELLYRGFMFQRLLDGLGEWPAQLLMAAFFTWSHWNNPGLTGPLKALASVNIFVASLLFGLAYLRTQRLALPFGLHLTANWVQGPLFGFGVSGNASEGMLRPELRSSQEWLTGGAVGLEASLPGLIAVVAAAVLLQRWQPVRPRAEGVTGFMAAAG